MEENKLTIIDEKELTKKVTDGSKEIIAKITEASNQDDFKKLVDLFNLNQSKKNALRMAKLDNLLDKIDNQIIEKFDKRPDQMSNSELIEFLKTVESSIDRSQKYIEKLEEKPMIQINQQTNNVTVNTDSFSTHLNRDSKQKVLDLVANLMKDIVQPSNNDVIDCTESEINEDDEKDEYYGEDNTYYSEGEGEEEW